MLSFYLCGSVVGRSASAVRKEREAVTAVLHSHGWSVSDPLSGEYAKLKGTRKVSDTTAELGPSSIALKDRWAIDSVDIVLWLTADVSTYGSCIVVGYAWATGKTIIAIDAAGRGRQSAFVSHVCTFIGDDLDSVIDFVQRHMTIQPPPQEATA